MERGFSGFWGVFSGMADRSGRGAAAGALFPLILTALALTPSASAKDLQGRLGLGYNSEFVSSQSLAGTPGVSLKYALTRDIAESVVFGVKSGSPSSSVIATKFFKNIFFETNLNFYFTAGLGYVTSAGSSGMELLGGFGSEFFIPGIESLGLSVETGASYNTLGGHSTLRTIGFSFLDAGIHFYF